MSDQLSKAAAARFSRQLAFFKKASLQELLTFVNTANASETKDCGLFCFTPEEVQAFERDEDGRKILVAADALRKLLKSVIERPAVTIPGYPRKPS
jgi:hypothetical protein